jgi:hypothetical protein
MARAGTIHADIVCFLRERPDGAAIEEITLAVNEMRRFEVPPHSIRSALYQHLGQAGDGLFRRVSRGRYALRR